MIQITRSQVRQFRTVFRRLAGRTPSVRPVVSLHANAGGLSIRMHRTEISAEYRMDGQHDPETLVLPFEALSECEGMDESIVTLTVSDSTTVSAVWTDCGIPQARQFSVSELPGFPEYPQRMTPSSPELLRALAEATMSAADEAIRYALNHVQLQGKKGQIAATDGHQLLIQRGFVFPWQEDLLIPGSKVFASKELTNPVNVGRTGTHVVIQAGPWKLFCPLELKKRYPHVDDVVPRESKIASTCYFEQTDAAFLLGGLRTLPGRNDDSSPVTIDLDDDVIVRARDDGNEGRATEVVLARSEHTGKAVRIQLNRKLLARALSLGLQQLGIANPDTPVVFKDAKRTLVVMSLDKDGAIPPKRDAVRIVSTDVEPKKLAPKRRKSMNTNVQASGQINGNGDGQAASKPRRRRRTSASAAANGLVEEAIALRTMLREACARSHALIAALKKQKRQGNLLRTTIASLRQLQHVDGCA